MRCLYCGKELALLKRLTGGGDFCSEAHKHSYQEEYNRLALSRLLQAQAKPDEKKGAPNVPPQEPAPVAVQVAIEDEPPPSGMAGFVLEKPVLLPLVDLQPYLEPPSDDFGAPEVPAWTFQNGNAALPLAELVELELHATGHESEDIMPEAKVTPKEFPNPKLNMEVSPTVTQIAALRSAGPIPADAPPRLPEASYGPHVEAASGFVFEVVFRTSTRLELPAAGIELPVENGDVTVQESPLEAVTEWAGPESTPRAALHALSRLHQEIIENKSAPLDEPPAIVRVQVAPAAQTKPALTAVPSEPDTQPVPHEADEFVDMPLKSFAPPKPRLVVEVQPFVDDVSPRLPRLNALPLRPKVAVAPPGAIRAATSAAPKSPMAGAKPKVATTAPPRPQPLAEAPAQKTARPAREAAVRPDGAQTAPPAAPKAAPPNAPKAAPKVAAKAAPKVAARDDRSRTAPEPDAQPALTFEDLNFQLMANANRSFIGALSAKVKIGIAAVAVVVLGIVAYVSFGGKAHSASPASVAAAGADIAGPSIMMGEGGWVTNWAGDTAGAHRGRQITFYRPSLSLSDYRIEFQGQIENKSIGWVFRAADPANYYAMKLAIVSPGLSPKIALYKYAVLSGRETEIGHVPVPVAARLDTMFSIRVDARGPKFSTFVQGQPVDMWTDDRLKSGGVGFLNERSERARIKSVSISYLTSGGK